MTTETALTFECEGSKLVGITHIPQNASGIGVLVIVGGPQYRVGSHRQFVLLSRYLAEHGIAVFRFDYRGMGDSEGEQRTFESIDADIRSALDAFHEEIPGLARVYLWGLCDAASAALFYAYQDSRVSGMVLLNPWVRSDTGLAKAYIKTYYSKQLLTSHFWMRLFTGKLDIRQSLSSILKNLRTAILPIPKQTRPTEAIDSQQNSLSYQDRMLAGLREFDGNSLFVISGDDITAAEFKTLANSSKWKKVISRRPIDWLEIADANHTFSSREWRDKVADTTLRWLSNQEKSR